MSLRDLVSHWLHKRKMGDYEELGKSIGLLVDNYKQKLVLMTDFYFKRKVSELDFKTKFLELLKVQLSFEALGETLAKKEKTEQERNIEIEMWRLRQILKEQEALVQPFYFTLLQEKVGEEGKLLAIEQEEIAKLERQVFYNGNDEKLKELKRNGLNIDKEKDIATMLLDNWFLTEQLIRKIDFPNNITFFKYDLPLFAGAGLLRSVKDLIVLDKLAGEVNPKYFGAIVGLALPIFCDLIKSSDDLKRVCDFLIELTNKLKFQNVRALFRYGFRDIRNLVKSIDDLEKIYDVLPDLLLRAHKLYREQEQTFLTSKAMIVRKELKKTGSETILLGGKLVGKVIIRIISEPAFLLWKKALEAKEVWQKAGFDYIPIEPIFTKKEELRAYKTKKGNYYRVYTKVLGMNLAEFIYQRDSLHNKKLIPQLNESLIEQLNVLCDRIETVLTEELKIIHGHLHYQNFCVEIQDDKIRLYVIDFDEAISPSQSNE